MGHIASGGFKTRYRLSVIDRHSGNIIGEPMSVDNMVLASGYDKLGEAFTYDKLSIGTNGIAVNPEQMGVLASIATMDIDEASFSQSITSDQDDTVVSIAAHTFLFKNFRFPNNAASLTVREIGLVGVTRAILPDINITLNNWLLVEMEVIYTYTAGDIPAIEYGGDDPSSVLFETKPFIYNYSPNNNTGRGWGAAESIGSVIWNGVEGDYRAIGPQADPITITTTLEKDKHRWAMRIQCNAANDNIDIPGIVLRDSINGGGFLVRFKRPSGGMFVLPEDGKFDVTVYFKWR